MNISAGNVSTNNPQSIDRIRVRFSRNGPDAVGECARAALKFIGLAKKLNIPEGLLRVTIKDLGNEEFEFRLTKRCFVHHSSGNQKAWHRLFMCLNLPMPPGCFELSNMPKSHMSLNDLYMMAKPPRAAMLSKRGDPLYPSLTPWSGSPNHKYHIQITNTPLSGNRRDSNHAKQLYAIVKCGGFDTCLPIVNVSQQNDYGIPLTDHEQTVLETLFTNGKAKTDEEIRVYAKVSSNANALITKLHGYGHYRQHVDACLNAYFPRYVHNVGKASCEITLNADGYERLFGPINKLLDYYKIDYTTVPQGQPCITVKCGNYTTKIPISNDSSTTGIHLTEDEQKTFGDLYPKINTLLSPGHITLTLEECRICKIITNQIDELIKCFSSLGYYKTFFDDYNAKNIKGSKIIAPGCEIAFNKDGYNRLSDKADIQLTQSPNQKTSECKLHLQSENFECYLGSLGLNDNEQNALKTLIETVNKNEKDSVDPTLQQIFLCNKVITKLHKMMHSDLTREDNLQRLCPRKISMTSNPSENRRKIREYCTEVRKRITSHNKNCKPDEKLTALDFSVKIVIDEKKEIATLFLLPTKTGFNHNNYQQSWENVNKLLGKNIAKTDTPLYLFHLKNLAANP